MDDDWVDRLSPPPSPSILFSIWEVVSEKPVGPLLLASPVYCISAVGLP